MRAFFTVLAVFIVFSVAGIRAYAADSPSYQSLSAAQIASVIDSGKGKRSVFFVYASWCPYCRATMPKIVDIAKAHPGQVITVSMDKEPDTLMRYLQKNFADIPFTPIVWNHSDIFVKPLERFGIAPGRAIPFTALLDEYGYVSKQGVLKPEEVSAFLAAGNKAGAVAKEKSAAKGAAL